MFRNCKLQCKFNQMGPLWAWWADISSKMPPKAGGRPGEDRGKTGGRPGEDRGKAGGGHGEHFGAFSVACSVVFSLSVRFFHFCNILLVFYFFPTFSNIQ